MALTNTELKQLAEAHAYRVIDNMSASELFSYAVDQLTDTFDVGSPDKLLADILAYEGELFSYAVDRLTDTFDVGSPDKLLADILAYEGEDMDSAAEFMIGAGVPESVVDEALEAL